MVNIFVTGTYALRANGLAALGDFHLCDLEMTPQRSSNVKVIADSESLVPISY